LDQSFDRDAFLGVLLGHDESAEALQAIAIVMKLSGPEGHWAQRADSAECVRSSAAFILAQVATRQGPPPTTEVSLETGLTGYSPKGNDDRATDLASKALEAVGWSSKQDELGRRKLASDTLSASGWLIPSSKK
jgi:hypothetical protein